MKKLIVATALAGALAFPSLALAASSDDPSCWGQITEQFAQSAPGAMGEHASSFAGARRSGIGNVAYDNTGTHQPSILGAFLGSFLGLSCE